MTVVYIKLIWLLIWLLLDALFAWCWWRGHR